MPPTNIPVTRPDFDQGEEEAVVERRVGWVVHLGITESRKVVRRTLGLMRLPVSDLLVAHLKE